ncbi:hypothetical protein HanHA89_Chr04g0163031 [Helianthus annuus]|nr:hypothetical protein HanHA89_Chr04g0163031 [Helianthus annuus]
MILPKWCWTNRCWNRLLVKQWLKSGSKDEESNASGDPLAQMSKGGAVFMVCRTCGKKG